MAVSPAKVGALAVSAWLLAFGYAGKYTGDFEELGASARAIGLGGAFVAVANDASTVYYNPSGTALLEKRSLILSHSENFAGIVKQNFLGFVVPSRRGGYGLALSHNGVPDIRLTEWPDTTKPPIITDTVNVAQFVGYFNFAQKVTDWFLLGTNAKVIYQNLAVGSAFGMGLDFGALVIPVSNLTLGFRMRNLTSSPLFWDTKTQEYILPRGAVGIMKRFFIGESSILFGAELGFNFEGLGREENIGAEYSYRNIFFSRLGFYNRLLTFGLGAIYKGFYLDYSYQSGFYQESQQELGPSQRISGGIRF